MWLGSPDDARYVHLNEDHAIHVNSTGDVFMGASIDRVQPTGIRPLGAVIDSEPGVVYSLTKDDEIVRQKAGALPTVLWKSPWKIDRLLSDILRPAEES